MPKQYPAVLLVVDKRVGAKAEAMLNRAGVDYTVEYVKNAEDAGIKGGVELRSSGIFTGLSGISDYILSQENRLILHGLTPIAFCEGG